MENLKKITGYFLVGLIILFTIIGILGIWDVIDLEDVIYKILMSLLIVFISSAVILFITSVLLNVEQKQQKQDTLDS